MTSIRDYQPSDADAVINVFFNAIYEVGSLFYTPEQIQAWAPKPIDTQYWQKRFEQIPPYVALKDNKIVGFMSLEHDGHIHWAYSHPQFSRQGIATMLLNFISNKAKVNGIEQLYTEASYIAQPFFSKNGFLTTAKNTIERNGQTLINFSMNKSI